MTGSTMPVTVRRSGPVLRAGLALTFIAAVLIAFGVASTETPDGGPIVVGGLLAVPGLVWTFMGVSRMADNADIAAQGAAVILNERAGLGEELARAETAAGK